jgi:hypothetical protein
MAKEFKNIGASVRARLLQLAKASGQSFDLVLTRFALERFLFRLSQKPRQWNAFTKDVFANPGSLEDVVASLAEFLMPHAIQARALNKNSPQG